MIVIVSGLARLSPGVWDVRLARNTKSKDEQLHPV